MSLQRPAKSYNAIFASPFGNVAMALHNQKLVRLTLLPDDVALQPSSDPLCQHIEQELNQYFANAKHNINVEIDLKGTPFQQAVWQVIKTIPAGQTLTYSDIAKQLKTGPRAIGQACRTNPLFLIIPCHRVVGTGGLGGYAGAKAGTWMRIKKELLSHEGFLSLHKSSNMT